MDKTNREIIKGIKKDLRERKLSKQDKIEYYNSIYQIYGSKIYKSVTPSNIKKKDIKCLLKSGKFEDIYTKYGDSIYRENIDYMRAKDIEFETCSNLRGILYRINSFIKKNVVIPLLGLSFALPTSSAVMFKMEKYEEEKNHLKEIEDYIDNIESYADSVKKMNLSKPEILMKVTKDMWSNIRGYGTPKKDLTFYPGLDLADSDGAGVCRNMADDVSRKLNAIDEDFNARVLNVYVSGSGYKISNIDTKILEKEDENSNEEISNDNDDLFNNIIKVTGNHAVVVLNITEDNATLILDPTNPGIGILKDGKIISFNTTKDSSLKENITPILNYFTTDESFDLSKQLLCSFKETNLSLDELEKKYGLDAQNDILKSLAEKEMSFKDSLVIDLGNNITAVGSLNKEEQIISNDKEKSDRVR